MSSVLFAGKTMASLMIGLVIVYNYLVIGVHTLLGIDLPNPVNIFTLPWTPGVY